jgi:hypothetical protein
MAAACRRLSRTYIYLYILLVNLNTHLFNPDDLKLNSSRIIYLFLNRPKSSVLEPRLPYWQIYLVLVTGFCSRVVVLRL